MSVRREGEALLAAAVECGESIPWAMVRTRISVTLAGPVNSVNTVVSSNVKGVTLQA